MSRTKERRLSTSTLTALNKRRREKLGTFMMINREEKC